MTLHRTLWILLFGALACNSSFGQIGIEPAYDGRKNPTPIRQEYLDRLKNSTTIFYYRQTDQKRLETFKEVVSEAWTFTEIRFEPYSKFKDGLHYQPNMSYFGMWSYLRPNTVYKDVPVYGVFAWLELQQNSFEDGFHTFATVNLYPSLELFEMVVTSDPSQVEKYMYTDATLYNWELGFLKNYLQLIDDHLHKKLRRREELEVKAPELSVLKNHTLYIPEYAFIHFDRRAHKEDEMDDSEKIFKKYAYRYEVLSRSKLSDMIVRAKDPVYYLSYVKSSNQSHVNVVNGLTGEIIYSDFSKGVYNLRTRAISKLSRRIQAAKFDK